MRPNKALLSACAPVLAGALALTLVCGCEKKPNPEDVKIAEAGESVRRSQALVVQKMDDSISAERARQLASRHLTLKQVNWGEPVATREDEDHFYVSYQTPERELRLIGARMLLVDKRTGVVSVQKRR